MSKLFPTAGLDEGVGGQLPNRAAVVRQLGQILSNGLFAQSPRMSGFLRFAVEQTLDGRSEQLKEYVIGVEVFGLGASYSPQEDPVVRITAGRLRGKLAEYYQTSGQSDAVRIDLPKGAYVPRFLWRQPAALNQSGAPGRRPGLHPSVGRDEELNRLQTAFVSVCSSKSAMVALSGEAGIGKTTLVEDFLSAIESNIAPPVWVGRGRCSEYLSETGAFAPIIESLETLVRGESNRQAAQLLQTMAPSWFRQLSPSSGEFSKRPSADDKTVSHERMRREFVSFFEELARARPVILFLDDLHWADASTCDLLAYFGSRTRQARILILGAYRAASGLTGQLPFMRLKIDLERHAAYQEVPVSLLNFGDVERYLGLRFPSNQFPAEFSRAVYERTEGSPLFMADLLRFLGDRKALVQRGGVWLLAESVDEVCKLIPDGVDDMIQIKIRRLEDKQRRILLCAAVQGLEFDSAALAQLLSIDPADLEERLQALEDTDAFVRIVSEREFPNRALSVRYRFAHVFYQNALYSSLVPSRRAEYSLALAQALVALNGENSQAIAADLAVLFESGRDFASASRFFLQAAQNAARVFAYPEAVALCQRGAKTLASLPESRDRDSLELDFSMLLGHALMPSRGYGSPETGDAHRRTRDLCLKLEDYGRLLPALWGLHLCEVNAGRLVSSLAVAGEMRQAAEKLADRFALGASLHAMGTSLAYIGRLLEARQSLEPIVANYPLHLHVFPGPLFVMDPIVTTLTTLSRVLAYLGYLDQAVEKAVAAVELAQRLAHAPSVVFAKFRLGWLRYWRAEYEESCTHLDCAIALGREHGISPAWARLIRGAAWSRMGRAEEGIDEIREGIAFHDATGSMLERPYCLTLLAEALSAKGATEEALELCDQALEIGRATEGRCYEPETLRLRGEILLSSGGDSGRDEAAALFQSAIELARASGSRVLELRAAVSSHDLHRGSPAAASSRTILAEVLDWFKEGNDSPLITHAWKTASIRLRTDS